MERSKTRGDDAGIGGIRRPGTGGATRRAKVVVDGAAQDAPAEMMMEMGQRRGPDDRASQVRLGHRAFPMKRPTKIASGTEAAHQTAKAASQGIHAASEGRADKSLGRGLPATFAASRKWAMREGGMPIVFQLWTVETGASIRRATAEVPPR